MKKETMDAGFRLLRQQDDLKSKIEQIVDGRAIHGKTSVNRLDQIVIVTKCPEQSTRSTYFNFNTFEDNKGELRDYHFLSSEAKQAISFQASMFHEAISAILLKEEKRLQNEFDNLKDE